MTIRIAPFQMTKSGGHGHGPDKDPLVITVQNARSGDTEAKLSAACSEAYTTAEVDSRIDAKVDALRHEKTLDLSEKEAAIQAKLSAVFNTKFDSLYSGLAAAKSELGKALLEQLRAELRPIIESEVRRILSEMQP